jgi:hypothetical protein
MRVASAPPASATSAAAVGMSWDATTLGLSAAQARSAALAEADAAELHSLYSQYGWMVCCARPIRSCHVLAALRRVTHSPPHWSTTLAAS